MNKQVIYTAIAIVALVAFAFFNGLPQRSKAGSDPLAGYKLLGIDGGSSELVTYDFNTGQSTIVGKIRTSSGTLLTGIEGAAYVPRAANMYGFWTDPDDGLAKLVYINVTTGAAIVIGGDLGQGRVTGAVATMSTAAVAPAEGDKTPLNEVRSYGVYAVLNPQIDNITGTVNINPTNSVRAEFLLYTENGLVISHSDLHDEATVGANGVIWEGVATGIRVRPKGGGSQEGLIVNGSPYAIQNNDTYIIAGRLNVKVYNDNVNSSGAPMGRWHATFESSLGTINEQDAIGFEITDGGVAADEEFHVKVTVIGAAINSGQYDRPVTMAVSIGGDVVEPFGDYSKAIAGNVNDGGNPREYEFEGSFPADTQITIAGQSWTKKSNNMSGASEGHWKTYYEFDSASATPQIKVLRDGDAVPNLAGNNGQASIAEFLVDYIDPVSEKVTLSENQAIYLFELGTTNLSSASADFQDLVVLVTLGRNADELDDVPTVPLFDGVIGGRLVKVDPGNGNATELMALSRTYDSLAAATSSLFYAASGEELYMLNPADGTETLIGTLDVTDANALEFLGGDLYGFTDNVDRLVGIDEVSGVNLTSLMNVRVKDLRSISFARSVDLPVGTAYD